MSSNKITAKAGVNIALIKYWGKRDRALNLPAVGSISMTLSHLRTETSVSTSLDGVDEFRLNGASVSDPRVFRMLEEIRARAGVTTPVRIESHNYVPTASGLASSASGSAALGGALWAFFTGSHEPEEVSDLIRIGSGSAPRSLVGGLVELNRETTSVTQLSPPERWVLDMVVAQVTDGPKATSSRDGMLHCEESSPYFSAWVAQHETDLKAARNAIATRDINALGEAMERSTMRMHACMMSAWPPLIYWKPRSLALIECVLGMRNRGIPCYFTLDAGPHVKILCEPKDRNTIIGNLTDFDPNLTIHSDTIGPGLELFT